jgi:hypothetical protein
MLLRPYLAVFENSNMTVFEKFIEIQENLAEMQ